MSANEQILGNVDGGEAPEQVDTSGTDDAADASSQSGYGDVVSDVAGESGAASSNTQPLDPSVPPANGARPLLGLAVELLRFITADLDPIGHHSARLSCKHLRAQLDDPPLMSHGEYIQFHKQYEAHSTRKFPDLLCPFCNTFKKSTPSKTTFSDAQAVQNYSGRRACIECGIANGHYDKRDVVIRKKKHFVCGACKLVLTHEKEEKAVADVVLTKAFSYRDDSYGRGAEITFASGGKRWCKPCRAAIAGLEASGAVKVRSLYMH